MNLQEEKRLSFNDTCFVCRWVGNRIILWPRMPMDQPQTAGATGDLNTGTWTVYVSIKAPIPMDRIGSNGVRMIEVCDGHWRALGRNWEAVAQSEVDLETQWQNHMDRTEG